MADPANAPPLTRGSVQAAHDLIRKHIHRTPVVTNSTLTALASTPRSPADLASTRWAGHAARPARPAVRLWFKCENLQRVGAFKVRGAFHAVERLKTEPGWLDENEDEGSGGGGGGGGSGRWRKGVVTHSSGNHAQALALAARESGIPAHIIMPGVSAAPKVAATRGYGARVVFSGSTSVEREAAAERVIAETGARLVPPYDHPDIVLGQGTLGLELQEQVEEAQKAAEERKGEGGGKGKKRGLDAIITPCGGGGMLSGVALSAEGTGIRVFGAEPEFEGADDGMRGYKSGERVEKVSSLTIADGLRTPVGKIPWSVIYERRLVAGMFNVTEDEILAALRLVYERAKLVVEPSAVVGLAVVLFNEEFRELVEREAGEEGWDIGVVFSGGNVDLQTLGKLLAV